MKNQLKSLLILSLLFVNSISLFSENISLNGQWRFKTDYYNVGLQEEWYSSSFKTLSWDKMSVPGCWNTRMEYSTYTGTAWYQTSFNYTDELSNHDLILFFEAVYSDADVWLNGYKLGSHNFGFTSFEFIINKYLVRDKPNVLTLRVNNSFKLGATWNWGGIRRSVMLMKQPKNRIDRIYISTQPDLKKNTALINTRIDLIGEQPGVLHLTITDPDKKVIGRQKINVSKPESDMNIKMVVKNVKLWSFDTPSLYTLTAAYETSAGRHESSERFGIRTVKIDGYKFLLNGKEVRLNGANYVPDDRFTGTTLPEEVFKNDIDLMKSCGVNMARLSHFGLPKDVLDYIDEKGILIVEEIPLWNRNKYVVENHPVPMKWLTELITQRYNHPCIIGWSAGNEIGRFSDNPDIAAYLSSAYKHIKSVDPTRLTVYVTHTAARQKDEPVLLFDMIFFNQYGADILGQRADVVHETYPGKPLFYAEYGANTTGEDLNNGLVDYVPMLESIRGREYLVGASVWTFNDYRSNYRDKRTGGTQNRAWGVVDAYRRKKRGYEILQKENSPVKEFDLKVSSADDSGIISGTVSVTPREKYDLPAYDLKEYQICVMAYDNEGSFVSETRINLPEIKVASEKRSYDFKLTDKRITKIDVNLVSPLGYFVQTLSHYLVKPPAPVVRYAQSSQSKIRVYFEKNPMIREVYARYGIDSLSKQSVKTINEFIELPSLEFGKEYQIQLVALNNAGTNMSNDLIKIKTQAAELPPIICYLNQRGEEIHIAYSAESDDFIYEFEYGLTPDNLSEKILTTDGGACVLPVIKKDADHYLRIRKRINYGYESQWSDIVKVNR